MSNVIGERRKLATFAEAAAYCEVSPRSIENWVSKRFIKAYRRQNSRELLVDLDELEGAFIRFGRTKMRDGRKTSGNVRIVEIVD
ncbi:hypothetical protein [Agromyces allii]|uniref:DNA-binding protein n=1 Tax=Agromyces allii TaxID=393607 RepID=A0ABP5BE40_9MICO|nr:hypothetical protein [Agromyces allii]